jgi:hypothetical protein
MKKTWNVNGNSIVRRSRASDRCVTPSCDQARQTRPCRNWIRGGRGERVPEMEVVMEVVGGVDGGGRQWGRHRRAVALSGGLVLPPQSRLGFWGGGFLAGVPMLVE